MNDETSDETIHWELKSNTSTSRDTCHVCEEIFKPDKGLWPFHSGTLEPICKSCFRDIDPEVFKPVSPDNNYRMEEKEIQLTNKEIIELAYLWKETIGDNFVGKKGKPSTRLSFSQARCFFHTFYSIRGLLGDRVDDEYLKICHRDVKVYFLDQELTKNGEHLTWEGDNNPLEKNNEEEGDFSDIPF